MRPSPIKKIKHHAPLLSKAAPQINAFRLAGGDSGGRIASHMPAFSIVGDVVKPGSD
jgi:hypothetical protein